MLMRIIINNGAAVNKNNSQQMTPVPANMSTGNPLKLLVRKGFG